MGDIPDVTFEGMEAANRIVADVLELLEKKVKPGVSTVRLDKIAEQYIRDQGGIPAFKGYRGYPATITTSINDQIVHGIPSDEQKIQPGDLVSIDVGCELNGCYGDSALTVGVEPLEPAAQKLMKITRESLYKGIAKARVGNRLGAIGASIEAHVVPYGFSVVKEWAGHFIGDEMHLDPQIPNYGPADWGPELEPGMYLAIEPMVNIGSYKSEVLADGWTVVTKDGSLSAHFEHSIAVTESGPKILSRRKNEVLM